MSTRLIQRSFSRRTTQLFRTFTIVSQSFFTQRTAPFSTNLAQEGEKVGTAPSDQYYGHNDVEYQRFDPSDLPPIEMVAETAVCDGHPEDGLGHPREFIRTDFAYPVRCKYCGTRFQRVRRKKTVEKVEKRNTMEEVTQEGLC